MEHLQPVIARLNERLNAEDDALTRSLGKAERMTGVPRLRLFLAGVAFLSFVFLWQHGMALLAVLIGFPYPAYRSLKAIESKQKGDDTQWLTYWVVYSVFSFFEYFSELLLGWFPFYYYVKIGFLLWCMWPIEQNGSQFMYTRFIRPMFLAHEKEIDKISERIGSQVQATGEQFARKAFDAATRQ